MAHGVEGFDRRLRSKAPRFVADAMLATVTLVCVAARSSCDTSPLPRCAPIPIPMRHANADAKSREDDGRFVLDGLRRRRSRHPRMRPTDERANRPSSSILQRLLSQLKRLLTNRSRLVPPPLRGCRSYAPCGSEGSKVIALGGLLDGARCTVVSLVGSGQRAKVDTEGRSTDRSIVPPSRLDQHRHSCGGGRRAAPLFSLLSTGDGRHLIVVSRARATQPDAIAGTICAACTRAVPPSTPGARPARRSSATARTTTGSRPRPPTNFTVKLFI